MSEAEIAVIAPEPTIDSEGGQLGHDTRSSN
jgi:hypothetical protein